MIILKERKLKRLFDIATTLLEQEIESISQRKAVVTIGVTGGSVTKFYEIVSKSKSKWSNVELFLLDERITSFQSMRNYPKIKKYFSKIMSSSRIHEIRADGNPFINAEKYDDLLKTKNKYGFDIIIISAGVEGHVASVFPRKNYLKKGYIFIEDSPKKPNRRITATMSIMKSAKVCFTFFLGEKKKDLLKEFQEGSLQEKEFPVNFVKRIKKSYVFTDIK